MGPNAPRNLANPRLVFKYARFACSKAAISCVSRAKERITRTPAMLDKTVGEVMTAPPITVEPATSVLDALSLMTRRRIRHLPVVEDGRVTGFVSIGDLVKYRIERIEAEAEAMRSYIQTA